MVLPSETVIFSASLVSAVCSRSRLVKADSAASVVSSFFESFSSEMLSSCSDTTEVLVVLSVEAELSVFALLPQPVSEAANIAAINEYIYILFIIILLFSRSIGVVIVSMIVLYLRIM